MVIAEVITAVGCDFAVMHWVKCSSQPMGVLVVAVGKSLFV